MDNNKQLTVAVPSPCGSLPGVDLIYDNEADTSAMKNVMLIHDNITDYNTFINAANSDTFPIVYNNDSCKEVLLQLLEEKFVSISRVAFVFHNGSLISFLDDEPLFTNEDLTGTHAFSNNMAFIIEISKSFQVTNLDFLACNTLQYDNWKTYFQVLKQHTGATIGASDNSTGNLKYGGDWILESTNEDIQNVYFTDLIENYQYTLATSITQSGGSIELRQEPLVTGSVEYAINGGSTWTAVVWPLTIINSSTSATLTVELTTDITLTSSIGGTVGYIIIGSNKITIEGSSHVVTVSNVTSYPGFVRNGISTNTALLPAYTNVSVQNIGVVTNGPTTTTTLATTQGWVCQSYFGAYITSGTISVTNCYSTGAISANTSYTYMGGIFGQAAGYGISGVAVLYAENCYSTGAIASSNSGGIFGYATGGAASGNAQVYAKNCYSTGAITGGQSGGIFAYQTGKVASGDAQIYAINCYGTGALSASNTGSIFGAQIGYASSGGQIYAENCYSTGDISGGYAGGIFGCWTGYQSSGSKIYAQNCYSTGAITSSASGGIFGGLVGYQSSGSSQVYATDCYSTGEIIGTYAGGIFGQQTGYLATGNLEVYAENCYSTGEIVGTGAGGIFGFNVCQGVTSTAASVKVSAENCYSTGVISGTSAGGIFGQTAGTGANPGPATVIAVNCYTIGAFTGTTKRGIYGAGVNTSVCKTVNCIGADNNLWVDSQARSTILITALRVWLDYSTSNNVPWLLRSFNATIYNPASSEILVGDLGQSGAGVFTPGYTYSIFRNPSPSKIAIDADTGDITFTDAGPTGTYNVGVLVGKLSSGVYIDYEVNSYTFVVGTVTEITFDTGYIYYTNLATINGGDIVTLANADPASGGSLTIADIVSVVLGTRVISISNFLNATSLTSLELSGTNVLETIADAAFQGCTILPSVTFPSSVTDIGIDAFAGCILLRTIIWTNPRGFNNLGAGAFNTGIDTDSGANKGTVTYNETADASELPLALDPADPESVYNNDYNIIYNSEPICFNKGTEILCFNEETGEEEYVLVENLKKGDLVKSYKHGYRKIDVVVSNNMRNNTGNWRACMYKMIKTDINGLTKDLIVTGGHSILVDDLGKGPLNDLNKTRLGRNASPIDGKHLLLSSVSKDFVKLENNDLYTWYHFTLECGGEDDRRYGVWANGILSETPSKNMLINHSYFPGINPAQVPRNMATPVPVRQPNQRQLLIQQNRARARQHFIMQHRGRIRQRLIMQHRARVRQWLIVRYRARVRQWLIQQRGRQIPR